MNIAELGEANQYQRSAPAPRSHYELSDEMYDDTVTATAKDHVYSEVRHS